MKILVRATNWIGDAIMSLPALREIRRRFPDGELFLQARPWVAAIYERERSLDHLIPLPAPPGLRELAPKAAQALKLRPHKFDLGILFPNSWESAALMRLAGARRIIGYARDGRSMLLTTAVPTPKRGEIPPHERFYYLELLRRAGVISEIADTGQILLDGADEARARGNELFLRRGIDRNVIGVSPGAAYGGAKRWVPERFAQAAGRLAAAMDGAVAVFGSPAERDLCEAVARAAGGHNLAGSTTLRDYIDMTAACRMYLTNDSGAMHISAALGVPTVTIFGPTDETATAATGRLTRVIREPVSCAPCLLRECPIDHRCMTGVTSDRVTQEAELLIKIAGYSLEPQRHTGG